MNLEIVDDADGWKKIGQWRVREDGITSGIFAERADAELFVTAKERHAALSKIIEERQSKIHFAGELPSVTEDDVDEMIQKMRASSVEGSLQPDVADLVVGSREFVGQLRVANEGGHSINFRYFGQRCEVCGCHLRDVCRGARCQSHLPKPDFVIDAPPAS